MAVNTNMTATNLDAVVSALYRAVSFKAGAKPDLDLLQKLFHPRGRLVRVTPHGVEAFGIDEFITRYKENLRQGIFTSFSEREIGREVRIFGTIAQVFSAYAAFMPADVKQPTHRGINSLQLVFEGGRWWVFNMLWDDERPDNPLPEHWR